MSASPASFDPYDQERAQSAYARMREQPGLFRLQGQDVHVWLATRYADVMALVKDKTNFARDVRRLGMSRGNDPISRVVHNHMLNQDPPDHTRLRRLIDKAFSPAAIDAQRGRIEAICDDLLDQLVPRGQMELVGDFAYIYPLTVICHLLGIPEEDHWRFRDWSRAFVSSLRRLQGFTDATVLAASLRYLRRMFDERRAEPRDDLLDTLLRLEEDGERLSEQELYSMVLLIIVAGHETVMNSLGNAVVCLLDRPDALATLRDGDADWSLAVEELLRFEGSVDRIGARWALRKVQIGGHELRRGHGVIPVLSAANRDPAVFDAPDELRLDRSPNPHIAFGQGMHFCVGARLARLEMQIALPRLLERLPGLALAIPRDDLKRERGDVVRRYAAIPVRWHD